MYSIQNSRVFNSNANEYYLNLQSMMKHYASITIQSNKFLLRLDEDCRNLKSIMLENPITISNMLKLPLSNSEENENEINQKKEKNVEKQSISKKSMEIIRNRDNSILNANTDQGNNNSSKNIKTKKRKQNKKLKQNSNRSDSEDLEKFKKSLANNTIHRAYITKINPNISENKNFHNVSVD